MKNPVKEQLDALRGERDQARDAAIQLASAEDFDPQDRSFLDLEERAAKLDTQIERLVGLLEAQNSADALEGKLSRSVARVEERKAATENPADLGAAFIASDQYRSYRFRGTSERFEWDGPEGRALPHTLATFSDVLSLGANRVEDITPPKPKMRFLPLATVIPVSTNNVDYVSWTKAAGGAAVVAEGAAKPSVEWDSTVTSASLETIAGYTQFSRQLAEDSQAIRAFLNGELAYEVQAAIEAEAKAEVAAVLPSTTLVAGPGSGGVLAAIRKGKAHIEDLGFDPNGFLVRTSDLIDLDVAVMTQTNSAPNETLRYWGMTPIQVPDNFMPAGDVVVGDFRKAITHYSRNSIELYFTDSHADTFTKNVLTALAETRCLTKVVRPGALVRVGDWA